MSAYWVNFARTAIWTVKVFQLAGLRQSETESDVAAYDTGSQELGSQKQSAADGRTKDLRNNHSIK